MNLRKEWMAQMGGEWQDCPFPLLTVAELIPLVEHELSLEVNNDQELSLEANHDQENSTVRGSDGSVANGNDDGEETESENGAGGDGEDADDPEQIGEHNGGVNNPVNPEGNGGNGTAGTGTNGDAPAAEAEQGTGLPFSGVAEPQRGGNATAASQPAGTATGPPGLV